MGRYPADSSITQHTAPIGKVDLSQAANPTASVILWCLISSTEIRLDSPPDFFFILESHFLQWFHLEFIWIWEMSSGTSSTILPGYVLHLYHFLFKLEMSCEYCQLYECSASEQRVFPLNCMILWKLPTLSFHLLHHRLLVVKQWCCSSLDLRFPQAVWRSSVRHTQCCELVELQPSEWLQLVTLGVFDGSLNPLQQ